MQKIITFDGGGIRGVLTATVLEQIVAAYPTILNNTTLLAGTSTGGIIALGLAKGMTPSDLRVLYQTSGSSIFDSSWRISFGGKLRSKYDNENLKQALDATFADLTLGQLKKEVLIPSFDLDFREHLAGRTWKPKFFTNRPGDADRNERVADVALRTSAAPTYFPIYQGYVDGGVVANNPSVAALAQSIAPRGDNNEAGRLDEVLLLSLGTGTSFQWIDSKDGAWGAFDWARDGRIFDIMIDGVGDVADFQCSQILGDCYRRLAPVFPPDVTVALDDVSKIDYLVDFGRIVEIGPTIAWLSEVKW